MSEHEPESRENEWFWRVVFQQPEMRRVSVRSVEAPHRAAAKQTVASRCTDIVSFDRCYVPQPSWDCPICGVSEGMTERPNMNAPPEWECLHCGTLGWGEPMEWEYLSEPITDHGMMSGHKTPDGPRSNAPTRIGKEVDYV